jgi:arsenate reductase
MSDYTIYHNPRCSKSRQTLELLRENKIEPKIVEYLQAPLKKGELVALLKKLNKSAKELIRRKEKVIAEDGVDVSTDKAALSAMVSYPILMERPIVVRGNKAEIGRPPENVLSLLGGK